MSNFPVGALLPLGAILVVLGIFMARVVIPGWRKSRWDKAAENVVKEEIEREKARPIIWANNRKGVVTAYLLEDLKGCDADAQLYPKIGIMIFTNDESLPRTNKYDWLELLAALTNRKILWTSEYAFYTIGRGDTNPADDIRNYGHLVLTWDQAVERAKSQQRAA